MQEVCFHGALVSSLFPLALRAALVGPACLPACRRQSEEGVRLCRGFRSCQLWLLTPLKEAARVFFTAAAPFAEQRLPGPCPPALPLALVCASQPLALWVSRSAFPGLIQEGSRVGLKPRRGVQGHL